MIKFDYRGVDSNIIGSEHGLNVHDEFNNYRDRISQIITDLNQRKDKPGQWLQWMNLGYNEETVWYVKENGEKIKLSYKGYDKQTKSQRYGFKPQYNDKRIFRIKCSEDRRIFTKTARSSHKWKRLYKKRTGVERINGRIDRDYKFEKHTIRGLEKMNMFITVTFLIYMTFAKIKIEKGQKNNLCRMYA